MTLAPAAPGALAATARAIRERLELVFPPAQFEHAFMPAKLTAKDWMTLTRRTPFVGLGWTDIEPTKGAGRLFTGESRWTIFLVTKNAAGIEPRYFGDRLAPGLLQLMQAGVAVLHGWSIPSIGTATVSRAGNLFAEGWDLDEGAVGGIDLSVGLELPVADALAGIETAEFLRLGIDWNFGGATQTDVDTVRNS